MSTVYLGKNKTIHCAKCNSVLLKTSSEEKLDDVLIKCKECGVVNEIKKVYSLEVNVFSKNR